MKTNNRNGIDAPFFDFDCIENLNRLRDIWQERIGGKSGFETPSDYRWFQKDDLIASARNAIILCAIPEISCQGNRWLADAIMWRDFIYCVLGNEPYETHDFAIIGLVTKVSQMVSRGYEERQVIIAHFVKVVKRKDQ